MRTKNSIANTTTPKKVAGSLRTTCVTKLFPLALLLAVTLPVVVQAQFTFATNNGALTVTKYTGSGSAVEIPSTTNGMPVTSIGNNAFSSQSTLTSVTIPNSVTSIGTFAFSYCSGLTNVGLGNGVASIGDRAFFYCYRLTGATIPNTVTNIGNHAFYYCYALTNLALGNGVTRIGDSAFFNCYRLASVVIPNSVTSIGSYAFSGDSGLTNVALGSGVTNLGWLAFGTCHGLKAITVDAVNPSFSSVDGVLFNKNQTVLVTCPGGRNGAYTIPNSVTNIEYYAFYSCHGLTNIAIGNSVIGIGYGVFAWCAGLKAINVDAMNPSFSSVDGVLFNKHQTVLVTCPGGKTGDYTVPNSVTNIGDKAFCFCSSLTSISIGGSVTSIGTNVFLICYDLKTITVDVLNPNYSSLDGVLFNKSQTTLLTCPRGKAGDYTIPASVTSIGVNAFHGCALTSVTIPNSVSFIGNEAFSYCESLTNITIGSGVISIGGEAFDRCTGLKGVYFRGNAPSLGGASVFSYGTVYYLPGTTGWGAAFGGRPTALWLPQVQTSDANFGVRTNQFGFNISWAGSMKVAVDACTDLANPVWTPLQTNTLTGDTLYFSDPQWTNHPARFYRVRWP